MLVIDNGDAIRGIAEVASKLDFIVNGYVGTTATQLADGQLASSEGDLYASGADATIVTSITIVNTDSAARTFTLYLKPSGGTSRAITPVSLDLGIGYSFYTDGQRAIVLDKSGNVVTSNALSDAAPNTIEPDDSASAGTGTLASRTDHEHAIAGASPSELASVQAAGEGSSTSFTRADHAHQIQHSIADNHLVTIDGTTNQPVNTDYAKFTASGLEGKDKAGMLSDLNVADGADVTGSNAPQAHKASHEDTGGDEIDVAGLSGLLADDQHILDAEAVAACEAAGLALASGKRINIISVLTSDQTWAGVTVTLEAGENLTIGQLVYMKSDGKMWKAVASAASTAVPAIALATGTINANNYGEFLLTGFFREDNVFNFTAGAILYVNDATAGALDETMPADDTEMVQRVGMCFPSAHIVYFKPDLTVCEVSV